MEPITTVCTRAELHALGYNDESISQASKAGVLDYLGPGIYGPPDMDGTREDRHRRLATAWSRKLASRGQASTRALAEVSAAAVLGLPLFGVPVNQLVAHDFSRSPGTRSTRVVRLVTDLRPISLVTVSGVAVPVVSPARTVVDIARWHARVPAIAIGDAALHKELCTLDELHHELDLAGRMRGVGRARAAVALMDGLSESVLESRSRITMSDVGLPTPRLQPSFFSGGVFLARADFWWPEFLLVGEADGDLKYQDDATASYREKTRTDGLHHVGIRVVRWKWHHVNDPETLAAHVGEMMTPPLGPLAPSVVITYPNRPAYSR